LHNNIERLGAAILFWEKCWVCKW